MKKFTTFIFSLFFLLAFSAVMGGTVWIAAVLITQYGLYKFMGVTIVAVCVGLAGAIAWYD
jgi:hypothetical protein